MKLFVCVVGLLALQAHSVVLWLWMILLALLVKGDFTKNTHSEFSEHLFNAILDVCTGFAGLVLDLLGNRVTLVFLGAREGINRQRVGSREGVHKLVA